MANMKPLMTKVIAGVGAAALLVSLGFSGMTYASKHSLAIQTKAQADKIATLNDQVRDLTQKAQKAQQDLKISEARLAAVLPENGTLKDNMSAFAMQAGTCEKLRLTLKPAV